jgi:hypothetical protein
METGIMETGKNAGYFSHDCNAADDPKIMLMMAQLGLEAYGIYWVLIEYLRGQPGYKAPIILLDPLSRRYGSSKEKFEAIVTKFDLFEFNEKEFSSPSLKRRMEPVERKREQQRLNISKRWNKNTNVLPPYNNGITDVIQSKEKKSKEKKSKVKESKEEIERAPFDASYHVDFNSLLVQKWFKWVEFRQQLKKPYKTKTGAAAAYNRLLELSNSNSEMAISIIQQSMDREWLDFYPLKTTEKPISIPGEDPVERDLRLTREARKERERKEAAEREKIDDMINDIELENMIENGIEK